MGRRLGQELDSLVRETNKDLHTVRVKVEGVKIDPCVHLSSEQGLRERAERRGAARATSCRKRLKEASGAARGATRDGTQGRVKGHRPARQSSTVYAV